MPGILTKRDRKFAETRKTTIDQVHDATVLFTENMTRENFNNNKLNEANRNIFFNKFHGPNPSGCSLQMKLLIFLNKCHNHNLVAYQNTLF